METLFVLVSHLFVKQRFPKKDSIKKIHFEICVIHSINTMFEYSIPSELNKVNWRNLRNHI